MASNIKENGGKRYFKKGRVIDMTTAREMLRGGKRGTAPGGRLPKSLGISEQEQAIRERVGQNMRKLREKKDLSQSEVARALKTNPARINRLEAGAVGVSISFLLSVCRLLEADIVEMFLPVPR
jgi:DNA-binding XRE family transcriptional regulator